ncbi:MAG: hypothetical protein QXE06_07820 [Candidatus Bathyarchaeia archaeon]
MEIDENLKVKLTRKDTIAHGILAVFALKGPKCYDDLIESPPRVPGSGRKPKEREELGSKGSVNPTLKHLERCKLIKIHQEIGNKKLYDLTLSGLLIALSLEPLLNHIEKVVEHHADKLPLILGKWNLFVDVKADTIVKKRMKEYLSHRPEIVHISPYHFLISGLAKKRKEEMEIYMHNLINEKFERHLHEDINRAVLFPWIFGIIYDFYVPHIEIPADNEQKPEIEVTDDMEKWISILLLDDELKAFLLSELDRLEKYGDFCTKVGKTFKHIIEKYPLYFYK